MPPFEYDESYAPTTPEPEQATPPAGGWIKLYRQALVNGWLTNPYLWTFLSYCLLKASHKPHTAIVGFQKVKLDAGQFIFGRSQASSDLKMSERKIRTCQNLLISTNTLSVKTTNRFSIITIVNWHSYQQTADENDQLNDQLNDQQVTSNRPASDQQVTTYKKGNKGEKKKKENTPPCNGGGGNTEKFLLYFSHAWKQYAPDRPHITNKDHHKTVAQMLAGLSKHKEPLNYLILQAAQFYLDLMAEDEPVASIKSPLLFFKSRQPAQAPMYSESIDMASEAGLWPKQGQDFWRWLQEVSSQ